MLPPLPIRSFTWAMIQNARALIQTTNLYLRPRAPSPPLASCLGDTPKPKSKNGCSSPIPSTRLLLVVLIADAERITAERIDSVAISAPDPSLSQKLKPRPSSKRRVRCLDAIFLCHHACSPPCVFTKLTPTAALDGTRKRTPSRSGIQRHRSATGTG